MALAAAAGLHVLALAVVLQTAPRSRAVGPAAPPEPTDVAVLVQDVALEPAATAANANANATPNDSPSEALTARLAHRAATTSATSPSSEAANAAGSSEAPDVVHVDPQAPAEGWSIRTTQVDLGVDGRGRPTAVGTIGAMAALEGTSTDRPQVSKTGGLVEGLHARDQALGLGRGGPVRSAVETVVQAGNTMGVATFEVRIGGSGSVSVRMVDASADAMSWSKLVDAISAEVTAHRDKLRLPPNVQGLRVTVRTEAKDRLPDGRGKPRGTEVIARPPAVHETKDRVDIELPSVTVGHEGKVCAGYLTVGLAGPRIAGGCSLENAGAHPVRIVATTIVSESFL